MMPGSQIHVTLMQAIGAASLVIVVVSRNNGQSPYVVREIDFAEEQRKPIIPLLLNEPNDDTPPAISGDLLSAVISTRYILGFRKDNHNVFNMLAQNRLYF